MDHVIPKLTLRRFKTRFSCSFLLPLLASCASERVQHHGAHPWIFGKLKQKRPKAILKNRHFLIKGVDHDNDGSSAQFANAGRLRPRTFSDNCCVEFPAALGRLCWQVNASKPKIDQAVHVSSHLDARIPQASHHEVRPPGGSAARHSSALSFWLVDQYHFGF